MEQPVAQPPRILVDDRPLRALGPEMTGAEILALAGAEPGSFDLYAEGHRGRRIPPEEPVPVQDGSRFRTRPRA